jgi:hypothetical protein
LSDIGTYDVQKISLTYAAAAEAVSKVIRECIYIPKEKPGFSIADITYRILSSLGFEGSGYG